MSSGYRNQILVLNKGRPLQIVNGWLNTAKIAQSPNYNRRPRGEEVDLLVVHNISLPPGEFGGPYIEQFFANALNPDAHRCFPELCELEVSSHFLIRRDGQIVQFVSVDDRAWHAGESCYQGVDNCNDFSIGVELEGCDTVAYTGVQYAALTELTEALLNCFPALSQERITGHSDIAPERKTDPGPAFDWRHYRGLLAEVSIESDSDAEDLR